MSLVSTNTQNLDPISNLTDKLSNISLENLPQNLENFKFKKVQLVTFNIDKVPYSVDILGRAGKTTFRYKNLFM